MNCSLLFIGTLLCLLSCSFNTKQGNAVNISDDHLCGYTLFGGGRGQGTECSSLLEKITTKCDDLSVFSVSKRNEKLLMMNIVLKWTIL